MMVATENPETARSWLEQVRPQLGQTPFLFVLSAQAAPVLYPYYQADPQQVQGMVVGVAGGAAYEQITGRVKNAGVRWDAYVLSVFAAGLLMTIGAVANIFLSMAKKPPRREAK